MSVQVFNKQNIQYDTVVNLTTIICCSCSVPFAIPTRLQEHLIESLESFYCPNGHSMVYSKSTADLLREQLQKKDNEVSRLNSIVQSKNKTIDAITRQKSAIKGQVTKLKNRVHNGVCPCCNRTFSNLANHMKNQHPDFTK